MKRRRRTTDYIARRQAIYGQMVASADAPCSKTIVVATHAEKAETAWQREERTVKP